MPRVLCSNFCSNFVGPPVNRLPNKEEVGFIFVFSGSELWTFFKYSRSKLKYQKPVAVEIPSQWYHSHADPISVSWVTPLRSRFSQEPDVPAIRAAVRELCLGQPQPDGLWHPLQHRLGGAAGGAGRGRCHRPHDQVPLTLHRGPGQISGTGIEAKKVLFPAVFRIRIGEVRIQSGQWIRIRIQEVKNDPES